MADCPRTGAPQCVKLSLSVLQPVRKLHLTKRNFEQQPTSHLGSPRLPAEGVWLVREYYNQEALQSASPSQAMHVPSCPSHPMLIPIPSMLIQRVFSFLPHAARSRTEDNFDILQAKQHLGSCS